MSDNMSMSGEAFLNKLYKDLITSEEVQHTIEGTKDKNEAVHRYMERLEKVNALANERGRVDLLKELYYRKYVVNESDIPHYRDKSRIIESQKESLSKWLDYLLDENAKYPMWAKYWAFQGMLKIGTYNEATGTYQKRSKNTLAPFIEVNPEVLARCLELASDYVQNGNLADNELNQLIENGNFQKLYTILLKKNKSSSTGLSNTEDGVWVTYNYETEDEADEKEKQGIEPEYLKLYNSLQGYNTGWCTAGSKEMAKDQVCGTNHYKGGDFHIYYTKDKDNKYKVPRIAIRMDKARIFDIDRIGEIRGIADGQNLEDGLENIVEEKLNSLGLSEGNIEYYQKVISNMRNLTLLNKKVKNNVEFTSNDLNFLYSDIKGFGWVEDPRINKLKAGRNKKNDFKKLDGKVLEKLIEDNPNYLEYISADIEGYREIILETVMQDDEDGYALEYVPKDIEGYREIALEAVKEYGGRDLKYVPKDVEGYREIALEAVKDDGSALKYVPKDVEGYREIALEAVKDDGSALEYVPKDVEGYREIVLEAVKESGSALEYVPKDIEGYREIVLEAVKESGYALEYVPKDIEGYREIVLEAVKKSGSALEYVPKDIEGYREIVLEAVKESGSALEYVPKDIEGYKEIVSEAVKEDGCALKYVPGDMIDKELVTEANKGNPCVIKYIPKDIIDKEMVLEAIKNQPKKATMFEMSLWPNLLKYVPEDMIDKEVAIEAIKGNPYAIEYVPEDVIDKDVALLIVKFGGNGLEFVPKKVMDKEIAMEAVKYDDFALRYVPKDIEGYFEIAKNGIMENPESLIGITPEYERYSELEELADKLIEEQREQEVGHRHKK